MQKNEIVVVVPLVIVVCRIRDLGVHYDLYVVTMLKNVPPPPKLKYTILMLIQI